MRTSKSGSSSTNLTMEMTSNSTRTGCTMHFRQSTAHYQPVRNVWHPSACIRCSDIDTHKPRKEIVITGVGSPQSCNVAVAPLVVALQIVTGSPIDRRLF